MSAVVVIPPIHVTLRAMWWLAKCERVFGGIQYPVPMHIPACEAIMPCIKAKGSIDWAWVIDESKRQNLVRQYDVLRYGPGPASIHAPKLAPKLWRCNVSDMRALVLGTDMAIDSDSRVNDTDPGTTRGFVWAMRKPITPTCGDCKVLMDMALSNPTEKHGSYPTKTRDGYLQDWKDI